VPPAQAQTLEALRQTSPSLLDMATQWQHSAQQQLETARLANNNH